MRLNKKGFTLIELIAVVVIMLAISVMAVSSISAAIKRNSKKQNETKIKVLVSYAELYYQRHKGSLGESGQICITEQFINEFNLSEDELTDSNGDEFSGCIKYDSNGNFEYNG